MRVPDEFSGSRNASRSVFQRARAELERRSELGRLRTQLAELERAHHRRPELGATRSELLPTGFAALDEALGGGWRAGALNEVLVVAEGCGAMEAFLPALASPAPPQHSAQPQQAPPSHPAQPPRLIAWIHPTRLPYPPALRQAGCDLSRWLLVRPRDTREQAWALDLVLRSGACEVVITWLHHLDDQALRRLQLAAEQSGALGLVFRPAGFARVPSPAAVRIAVTPQPSGSSTHRRLAVTLLRCRGGTAGSGVMCGEPIVLEWSRDPLDEPSAALATRDPAIQQPATHPPEAHQHEAHQHSAAAARRTATHGERAIDA